MEVIGRVKTCNFTKTDSIPGNSVPFLVYPWRTTSVYRTEMHL